MSSQKNKWDSLAWGLAESLAKQGDKKSTPVKMQPSIVVTLDPITAVQLLVTTRRYHDFQNMELSLALIGILDELKKHYPEIEHLLKDTSLTDQQKIEKSKLIFGVES